MFVLYYTHMKKRDLILLSVLILVSITGYLLIHFGRDNGVAIIYVDRVLYGTYDLADDQVIHIANENGIVNDIRISNGCIFMENATCPGRQCVKTGRISHVNESICCAPAKVLIMIASGEESSEYDAVTK